LQPFAAELRVLHQIPINIKLVFVFKYSLINSRKWIHVISDVTTEAAMIENDEASAKLTTANGGTFT